MQASQTGSRVGSIFCSSTASCPGTAQRSHGRSKAGRVYRLSDGTDNRGLTDGSLAPPSDESVDGNVGSEASRAGLLSGRSRDVSLSMGREVSLAALSVDPQLLPVIGWPSGQKRVIAPFVPALLPNVGAVRFAFFVSEGNGEHNAELPEHTEANVQLGTKSRQIWMTPPSRVTLAVCPRSSSWMHLLPAQTLALPSCSATTVCLSEIWISRMVPRTPIDAVGVSIL